MATKTATFAAGCFWGVEHAFRALEGVVDVRVGYTGGHTESPTYKDVCSGTTGHAEAVEVVFDAGRISFVDLVAAFFEMHDPMQVDRQGPDVGSQYRSAIFFHDADQKNAAEVMKTKYETERRYPKKIATEIVPVSKFWPAEEYHQRYFEKQGIKH